jgi:biotin operon repressor
VTLSLRAWGALVYLVNSDATISAEELARRFKEGRKAILPALRELRDAGYIMTRKERLGSKWVTVSYVTEKGFRESLLGSPQTALLLQQNSYITQYANSSKKYYESTNFIREEGFKVGYEFFDKTSNEDDEVRQSRAKAQAEKNAEYESLKTADQQKRFTERKNRAPKDWTVTDVSFEFANRLHSLWHIKPWKVTRTRFTQALGQNRKKFETDGAIELEMLNLFFASMDFSKYSDADALWKIFISRYSELASQAKVRLTTPEEIATAKVQAKDSWKGL